MNRSKYYSTVMPIASIFYVIVMFLVDWNSAAVVVGALVIALTAIAGRFVAPGERG